jgi:hypothetical protein
MTATYKFQKHIKGLIDTKNENKKKLLILIQEHPTATLTELSGMLGVSPRTITNWRAGDPQFDQKVKGMRAELGKIKEAKKTRELSVDGGVIESFIEFRKEWFGFDTPWFQAEAAERFETSEPGSITVVLFPPEHGKTTLTEDHLTYEIARDPGQLITIVSEGERMARKMSRRIQRRLEPDGSSQDLVIKHGPFRSPTGARSGQPWSVDAWTVHKGMNEDSRDFTVAVGGWKSNIAGTRATRLHIDDMQSLKSLNASEQMIDIFRQDMLSRPGESGRTTINGTRVGENDIYERMNDLFGGEDFFRMIKYPAIVMNQMTGEPEPLWGELYTMEKLDRMRKKVGEEAWFRNYMQNPRSSSIKFFTEEGIAKCKNSLRRIGMNRGEMNLEHNECWLTLDPAIGGKNVVMAMHFGSEKLVVLDIQEDTDLARNSAIAAKVADVCERMLAIGMNPTTLVIESMAFQKGLMEDEAFIELARKYGLRLESHETGLNKYDEDIGMASLASSVENGSIDIPWGDEKSEFMSEQLIAQFRAWKPIKDRITGKIKFQRGNQLRQDQLMALWFGWIWWTSLRTAGTDKQASQSFNMGGLPFTPTSTGLLVPR